MLAAAYAPSLPAPAHVSRRIFETIERHDPDRQAVEAFIAGTYRRHYGAAITQWAPTLVALRTDGRLVAAAGYRRATTPLYLEHYLDVPVEQAIAACSEHGVERRDVWEVGHFASTQPGEGRRLLVLLARHLASIGCRWVASTATQELRRLLVCLGLTPWALASADPRRLGLAAADWGRYYEQGPVVVAGDLTRSLALLEKQRKAG